MKACRSCFFISRPAARQRIDKGSLLPLSRLQTLNQSLILLQPSFLSNILSEKNCCEAGPTKGRCDPQRFVFCAQFPHQVIALPLFYCWGRTRRSLCSLIASVAPCCHTKYESQWKRFLSDGVLSFEIGKLRLWPTASWSVRLLPAKVLDMTLQYWADWTPITLLYNSCLEKTVCLSPERTSETFWKPSKKPFEGTNLPLSFRRNVHALVMLSKQIRLSCLWMRSPGLSCTDSDADTHWVLLKDGRGERKGKKYCDCEIKVWEKLRNIACKCKSFNGGKIGKMDSCQEEQLSSTGKYYAHCKRSILKKTNRGVFYGNRPDHLYIYALYPCRLCGILGHGFEIWNASCRQWQPGRLPHHFPLLVRTGRCLAASQEGWNGSDAVLV